MSSLKTKLTAIGAGLFLSGCAAIQSSPPVTEADVQAACTSAGGKYAGLTTPRDQQASMACITKGTAEQFTEAAKNYLENQGFSCSNGSGFSSNQKAGIEVNCVSIDGGPNFRPKSGFSIGIIGAIKL